MRQRGDTSGWRAGVVVGFVLLAWPAAGCARIEPEGPPPLPPPARTMAPLPSVISAPLAIPLSEVDSLLNGLVPAQLYAVEGLPVRKGIARARVSLDVRRDGRIRLETREGRLTTYIPLRVQGSVRAVRITRPFETTFTVHATSDIALGPDWATEVTTRTGFTWETVPAITLLGFTINLEKVAGNALTKELERLAPRLDSLVEHHLALRPQMERIWEDLAEPIVLQREPPIWLQARPTDVFLAPPESRGDTLVYGLRLHALLTTSVGAVPPRADLGPLPPLRPLPAALPDDGAGFQAHVPLTITYADASALLGRTVAGRDYDIRETVAFAVTGLHLYGHGASLVARLDFEARTHNAWFATQGRVFMTGLPRYDPDGNAVRVDSFDYHVASEDALMHAADWALREHLLEQVRDRLALPLDDRLDTLQVRIERALDGRALGRFLVLQATVRDLEMDALYLTPDGIGLDARVHGALSLRLRSLARVARPRPTVAPAAE